MTAEQQTADFERWQPQPMRSFTDKADLKRFYNDPRVQAIPKSFINGVKDMTFDWEWRWAWDPRLSGRLKNFTYAETPGAHCDFNSHPEELATAVIDLAEYEHRGEAYAREQLWRKSPRFVSAASEPKTLRYQAPPAAIPSAGGAFDFAGRAEQDFDRFWPRVQRG